MKKQKARIFFCLLFALALIMGFSCATLGKIKTVILRMPIYGQQDYEYFTEKVDINKEYHKVKPYVTIEMERIKDTNEFENAMKIRKAAGELPELMPLKPYMLATFKDALLPLNDLAAAKNNLFAQKYAVDGTVVGIPQIAFNEFVYYRKSIFKEYNLTIPKTWSQFIETAQKIKAGGKYIPIVLCAKDAWPDYPFNEFMPSLTANDGKLWNTMATQDEPFSKDKPFYKAYAKVKQLYDAKVFGQDPLGLGYDQGRALFVSGKGAMICLGQWFLPLYIMLGGDMSDLGAFLLPVRDNPNDTLNTIAMADEFLATPKDGKYKKEAKDFINWFFSNKYYPGFITDIKQTSTVKGVNSEVPFLKEAFSGVKVNYVLYDGGNADFKKIADAVKFDVKRMGQEMLMGRNLDEMMAELNKGWKEARAKANLK